LIVPDDKARVIFNNIIQDIIYGWHNRLWNNSFNNLDISEDNLGANLFVKASLFFLIVLVIIFNYLLISNTQIFIEYWRAW